MPTCSSLPITSSSPGCVTFLLKLIICLLHHTAVPAPNLRALHNTCRVLFLLHVILHKDTHTHAYFPNSLLSFTLPQASPTLNIRPQENAQTLVSHPAPLLFKEIHFYDSAMRKLHVICSQYFVQLQPYTSECKIVTFWTDSLSLSLQEMIIDKVNGQPVPRYLIYDIIKFNVSILNISEHMSFDPPQGENGPGWDVRVNKQEACH